MIETIIIGIGSSAATEAITWLNKKLMGTLLDGKGAFLLSLAVALVGATAKVFATGIALPAGINDTAGWGTLFSQFAQVWVVSQLYFTYVTKTLGIDVQQPPQPIRGARSI